MSNVEKIYHALLAEYPNAGSELDFNNSYELFVAVILSAQSTDKRVNKVTKNLFKAYPNFKTMAQASISELECEIHSIGLAHTKAKNIISACRMICEQYSGKLPRDKSRLIRLPGIGEKSANVILNVVFDIPALAVDTHVFRLANRLGLIKTKSFKDAQQNLEAVVPKIYWNKIHHLFIWHGRRVCHARKPLCQECIIGDECISKLNLLKAIE